MAFNMAFNNETALIATGTLDRFGDLVRRAAVPVAVYAATGRASAVGIVFAASFIPHLGMLAISSRLGAPVRARGSLMAFNLARFVVSLAMMVLAAVDNFGVLFLAAIVVLAALTAVVEAAFGTATRLVATEVEAKSDRSHNDTPTAQRINARLSTWQNGVAATVGLPLGGWLGAVYPPLAFAVDAATYLLAAGVVAGSSIAKSAASKTSTAAEGVGRALRWLQDNPFHLAIVMAGGALNLASGLTLGNLIVVAVEQFALPDSIFGVLMLVFSGASTIGSLFIARTNPKGLTLLQLAALPSVVAYLLIAFSSTVVVLIASLIVMALSIAAWNIASAGRMQADPPDHVVGGVLAFWRSTGVGAIAAGSAIGGFMIETTSPAHSVVLSASVCTFATAVMWLAAGHERSATTGLADAS